MVCRKRWWGGDMPLRHILESALVGVVELTRGWCRLETGGTDRLQRIDDAAGRAASPAALFSQRSLPNGACPPRRNLQREAQMKELSEQSRADVWEAHSADVESLVKAVEEDGHSYSIA